MIEITLINFIRPIFPCTWNQRINFYFQLLPSDLKSIWNHYKKSFPFPHEFVEH